MLTVTPRHVRRLAEAGTFGPIHRAGRMLLIPAAGVTAHRARAGEVA